MATVAVVLKKTKKLSNGEYAVAVRATHERDTRYYPFSTLATNQSLPWRCKPQDWRPPGPEDNGLGLFKKSFPFYKDCNEVLKDKLTEAKNILKRYDEQGLPFTFDLFETDLKKKEPKHISNVPVTPSGLKTAAITDYYTEQIKILEEQGRMGLAGLFTEVQSALRKFKPHAQLIDVNFRFLESFEYWLRNTCKNKDTTISVKMRNLQRVINLAIEDKLFSKDDYPFGEKRYSINKRLDSRTKKIAITLDKIARLKALELEPGSALHFAQQIFLFSYYSRGMNFVDMTYLKWSQITATHISYVRRKTRGNFEIPINDFNRPILEYYRNCHSNAQGFVFPILDLAIHKTLKQQYTRKKTALKAVNDNLKKLAGLIDEPSLKLTTNVGRHTYATGLKRSGANTAFITEALGHATQEQTQTYLAEFESGAIEVWEAKIFQT